MKSAACRQPRKSAVVDFDCQHQPNMKNAVLNSKKIKNKLFFKILSFWVTFGV